MGSQVWTELRGDQTDVKQESGENVDVSLPFKIEAERAAKKVKQSRHISTKINWTAVPPKEVRDDIALEIKLYAMDKATDLQPDQHDEYLAWTNLANNAYHIIWNQGDVNPKILTSIELQKMVVRVLADKPIDQKNEFENLSIWEQRKLLKV